MSTGLDFTTIARVKALIGETTTAQDTLVQALVTSVSARMEGGLSKYAKAVSRTEAYSLPEAQTAIMLKGVPVTSVTSVKVSQTRDFTNSTALVANTGYVLEPDTGLVRITGEYRAGRRGSSSRPILPIYIEMVYTGGMAADTAAFVVAYPDLAQAADLQVSYLHKRRYSPGGNMTVGSGSTTFEKPYELLPEVVAACAQHRRVYWS